MAELDAIQSYFIDGYVFETRADYEEALQEKKGINYLRSQLDLNNSEKTFQLYTELIEKKIFRTVIGMDYLKQLRNAVLKNSEYTSDSVPAIPVTSGGHKEKDRVEKYVNTKYEATVKKFTSDNKKLKKQLGTAVIVNIVLAIVIGVMFYITGNSSNPNILNYERAIQDKYSVWEQSLKEKEQELKDREWKIKEKEESFNSQN